MRPLILRKVGGSLITDKDNPEPTVNFKNLRRIVREVAEGYSPERMRLIFAHGAGSYGHQIVKRTGIHKGIKSGEQILAFAETQRLQNELNSIVTKELIKNGVPAMPIQCSCHTVMEKGELVEMHLETVRGYLEVGLVPVFFGVPAFDRFQKCSILSADKILAHIAREFRAEKVIHATDVDGVFDANPKEVEDAKLVKEMTSENFDEIIEKVGHSSSVDVTGGMFGKVREILASGVPTEIINGNREGYIKSALLGETGLGTRIIP